VQVREEGEWVCAKFKACAVASCGHVRLQEVSAQAPEAEGLDDVIVDAGIETEDLIGIGAVRGEHKYGLLEAVLAQMLAQFPAIHVGQSDIQHDQVRQLILDQLNPLCGVLRCGNPKYTTHRQLLLERLATFVIVVDDEKFRFVDHDDPTHGRLLSFL